MSQWEASGKSNDWHTPKYIFEPMRLTFDLDVSAPKEGPRHVPCKSWRWCDGLEYPWYGTVWMNAPFGGRNGLKVWLDKFVKHHDGIALAFG